LEAAALGQVEFYLNRPTLSPDEQSHRVITGSLEPVRPSLMRSMN